MLILLPIIMITQLPESNISWNLFKWILRTLRPPDSQFLAKTLEVCPRMNTPKLPAAILTGEAAYDHGAARVFVNEVRAVVNDIIYHYPNGTGKSFDFLYFVLINERQLSIRY